MSIIFTMNGYKIEVATPEEAVQLIATMPMSAKTSDVNENHEVKKTSGRTMRRIGGITLEDMVKSVFDETDRALTKYRVYDIIVRDYKGLYAGQIQMTSISHYLSKMTKEGEIRRVGRGVYMKDRVSA